MVNHLKQESSISVALTLECNVSRLLLDASMMLKGCGGMVRGDELKMAHDTNSS